MMKLKAKHALVASNFSFKHTLHCILYKKFAKWLLAFYSIFQNSLLLIMIQIHNLNVNYNVSIKYVRLSGVSASRRESWLVINTLHNPFADSNFISFQTKDCSSH